MDNMEGTKQTLTSTDERMAKVTCVCVCGLKNIKTLSFMPMWIEWWQDVKYSRHWKINAISSHLNVEPGSHKQRVGQ